MMWSTVSIFALVGPLIAAALKRQFGMDAVGYWAGATLLVASVLFVLARWSKKKELAKSSETSSIDETV